MINKFAFHIQITSYEMKAPNLLTVFIIDAKPFTAESLIKFSKKELFCLFLAKVYAQMQYRVEMDEKKLVINVIFRRFILCQIVLKQF